MKVLGITGGTGSGKTVVCRMLKEQGCKIIDADQISKKLQAKGEKGYTNIVEAFGEDILQENGEIDRKKLGGIVFYDKQQLNKLNSLMHKLVGEEIKKKLQNLQEDNTEIAVLDVPIPVEYGFFDVCHCIWAVVANNDIRIERIMKRMGITEEEAEMRIASQLPSSEYEAIADVVIINESNVTQLKKAVMFEFERFKAFY